MCGDELFVCVLFVCVHVRVCVCVRERETERGRWSVAWWLKQIRQDSEFCDELCCSSGGSGIASGHSELEEWNWWELCLCVSTCVCVCVCVWVSVSGQTVSLSSPCLFSFFFIFLSFSLPRSLSRFTALSVPSWFPLCLWLLLLSPALHLYIPVAFWI